MKPGRRRGHQRCGVFILLVSRRQEDWYIFLAIRYNEMMIHSMLTGSSSPYIYNYYAKIAAESAAIT